MTKMSKVSREWGLGVELGNWMKDGITVYIYLDLLKFIKYKLL